MKRTTLFAFCLFIFPAIALAQRWTYTPQAWPTPQQYVVTNPYTGRSQTVWVTPAPQTTVQQPLRLTIDGRGNIRTSFELVPGLVLEPDEDD